MRISLRDLPEADASLAVAVCHLEANSHAIRQTFSKLTPPRSRPSPEAYRRFRKSAYRLLAYYVDHDFQDAFRWLLMMNGDAPQRTRITLEQNPFHWGLLAVTSAAGTFMSPNKLRDLAGLMKRAHAAGVPAGESEFEDFIIKQRKLEHRMALDRILNFISHRDRERSSVDAPTRRPRRPIGRRRRRR